MRRLPRYSDDCSTQDVCYDSEHALSVRINMRGVLVDIDPVDNLNSESDESEEDEWKTVTDLALIKSIVMELISEDPKCGIDILGSTVRGGEYDDDDRAVTLVLSGIDLSDLCDVEMKLICIEDNPRAMMWDQYDVYAYLIGSTWFDYWDMGGNRDVYDCFPDEELARERLIETASHWCNQCGAFDQVGLSGCMVLMPWFTRHTVQQVDRYGSFDLDSVFVAVQVSNPEELTPDRDDEIAEEALAHWLRVATEPRDVTTPKSVFHLSASDDDVSAWIATCKACWADTGEIVESEHLSNLRLICMYLSQITDPAEPTVDDVLASISARARP